MTPFWIALQFLTRLPGPRIKYDGENIIGQSALFYPLVGAIIGLLLSGTVWLIAFSSSHAIPGMMPEVIAALVLLLWVSLTGALHLDGLGDSADGWLGGGQDKQRSLEIMQDPRAGIAAVVAIFILLLLKFTALAQLLSQNEIWPLLLAPILARTAVLGLLLSTPSARPEGFAAQVSQQLPRNMAIGIIVVISLLMLFVLTTKAGIVLLGIIIITLLLRHLMLKRLAGATGDTCGALIEVVEASTLLILCFL